jgi:beta-glucosidase
VVASHGYRTGEHAPGVRDNAAAAAATHHLLLGHGLAARALRDILPAGTPAGITLDLRPVYVLGDQHRAGLERARQITDAELNGLFLDPLLHGRYPEHARPDMLPPAGLIAPGDMETICQPLDFLGVNYYFPVYLRAGDPADLRRHERPARSGVAGAVEYRPGELGRTSMGWLVDPNGLYDLLLSLSRRAPGLELYVTENGCAAEDYVNQRGQVHDLERVRYIHQHLAAAGRAIRDGARLAGYFVWSLLDNFEWAWGYQKRFGIVYVDYETQRRIPKASARFYSQVARANAVPPLVQAPPGPE